MEAEQSPIPLDGSGLKAVEDAEVRLEARSVQRRRQLERRDRRRRWMPWLLCPLPIPALGAGALVGAVESAGGDLGEWPTAQAIAVVAACLLLPAALSAWVGRRHGRSEAVLWAGVTLCVEVALAVGIGFAALGLGPE
jgi:hypothetical protein